MFSELEKYENNGHFFFEKGNNLKECSKNVPDLPGVYYFLKHAKGEIELVYIGKSGTILQNGKFKEQGLLGRLNNKQEGVKREDFFNEKCKKENIDAIEIYWFVTFDERNKDLPGFVEGQMLQVYYDVYEKLPLWNKEF